MEAPHECWTCLPIRHSKSFSLLNSTNTGNEAVLEQGQKPLTFLTSSIQFDVKTVQLVSNVSSVKFLLQNPEERNASSSNNDVQVPAVVGINSVIRALALQSKLANQLLGGTPDSRAQVNQWLSWRNTVQLTASARLAALDAYLAPRAVLAGLGTAISLADLATFGYIHDSVAALAPSDRLSLPHLMRWFDYIQHEGDVDAIYDRVDVPKPQFRPPTFPNAAISPPPVGKEKQPLEQDSSARSHTAVDTLTAEVVSAVPAAAVAAAPVEQPRSGGGREKKEEKEKKKKEKPPAVKQEVDCNISVLDIRVGIITEVKKHPGADTLYVEQIDIGEGAPRQIVSGLAKFLTEEEMKGRKVAVLTNVKPGKVRDVLSSGLVLCASNADHSQCQPIIPPSESKPGDKVFVQGHVGKAEDVLNPKKKQFETIQLDLKTDAQGVVVFRGEPLRTSGGLCTSTVAGGNVK